MTVTTASSAPPAWLIACGPSLGPCRQQRPARFAYGLVLPAMRQDYGSDVRERSPGIFATARAQES